MSARKKNVFVFMAALILTGCFCGPSFALMVGLGTDKLTRDAELVVTGYVEDVTSQWTPDNKAITTTAVVNVEQIVKGVTVRQKVEVVHMGGQVGDLIMKVSDEASMKKGEKVLLFLSPEHELSGGSACKIQGRAQGKYEIGEDGIARKGGFSVDAVNDQMDNDIHVDKLTEKIRKYSDEK
jgi:hypothetical protein